MAIQSEWFKYLEAKDQKKQLEAKIREAREVLNVLDKIVEEKNDSSRKHSLEIKNYDNASWPYLQADAVGYQRALEQIRTYLNID